MSLIRPLRSFTWSVVLEAALSLSAPAHAVLTALSVNQTVPSIVSSYCTCLYIGPVNSSLKNEILSDESQRMSNQKTFF